MQPLGRLYPVDARHLQVQYDDLCRILGDHVEDLLAAACHCDDRDVILETEQRAQCVPDEGLVVGEDDPDRAVSFAAACLLAHDGTSVDCARVRHVGRGRSAIRHECSLIRHEYPAIRHECPRHRVLWVRHRDSVR